MKKKRVWCSGCMRWILLTRVEILSREKDPSGKDVYTIKHKCGVITRSSAQDERR